MTNNPYRTPKQTETGDSTRASPIALVLVAIIMAAGVIGYRNFQHRTRMQAAAAELAARRSLESKADKAEQEDKPAESTAPHHASP